VAIGDAGIGVIPSQYSRVWSCKNLTENRLKFKVEDANLCPIPLEWSYVKNEKEMFPNWRTSRNNHTATVDCYTIVMVRWRDREGRGTNARNEWKT